MYSNLLTFGDSWPYGSELPVSVPTYGKLIANKLDISYFCFANPATSIEHMILQLQQAIPQLDHTQKNLAIFTLTSPTRSIYFNSNVAREIYIGTNDAISKNYFKYLWSDALDHLKVNTTILALQHICSRYNIDDYYVSGFNSINPDYYGIDVTRIFNNGNMSLADLLDCQVSDGMFDNMDFCIDHTNKYITPNICHPNQLGHEKIAEVLYKWIIT
jgi:hypothetical protein